MEKEASSIAKALGWGALNTVHNWTTKELGGGLKWLSRKFFANPETLKTMGSYDPTTGKWIAKYVKNPTSWRQHLQNFGYKLNDTYSKQINNRFKRSLTEVGRTHGNTARNIVKWAPAATTGYLLGGELLLDEKNPLSWPAKAVGTAWQWMSPMGLASNAVIHGVGAAAKGYGRNVAMQTADQIASGIQEKGRLGHLYGVFSPTSFSDKLRAQAYDQINTTFR